jgi:cation transport regulator ChaC
MNELYFAYGSNVDERGMREACPCGRCLGIARLPDHRLAFTRRSIRTGTGVADVLAAPGEVVWGVLYGLRSSETGVLDRKEGAGWAYVRRPCDVILTDGQERAAFLYTVLHKESREVPPSEDYLGALVAAARQRGLPAEYLERLQQVRPMRWEKSSAGGWVGARAASGWARVPRAAPARVRLD